MVQVDPIKPTLKAPGTKPFKLEAEKLLSNHGFKFDLRRYIVASAEHGSITMLDMKGRVVDSVQCGVAGTWADGRLTLTPKP